MRPASLELAMKGAMRPPPAPPAMVEAELPEPSPAVAEPPPATEPKPAWRRGFSFLKRPAEFIRGYLQAPMHNRLNDIEVEMRAERSIAAVERVRIARLEDRSERIEEVLRHFVNTTNAFFKTTSAFFDRTNAFTDDSRVLARDAIDRLSHLATAAAQMQQVLDVQLPRIAADAATTAHVIGPRFDELDIKSRPLVAFDPDAVGVHLADGWVLCPSADPAMLTMLAGATSGGLEPGTRQALQRLARPGMACADVGANIGLLTLALARAVGPQGAVWAFEPEPGPHGLLARTLPLNGLSWAKLSASAAGARAGRATFHISPILGHSSLYALPAEEEAAARLVEVEVAPLDTLIPEGQALDVVKIDVEGAELDVLAGMSRLLAENRDIALVVEYGPSHLARVGIAIPDWFAAFAAHGFKPFAISEADGSARAVKPDELADVVSVNLAFVRPRKAAEARLLGRR